MQSLTIYLLLFLVVFCFLPSGAYAFGAGDIPGFAWLNEKAYRHGDIESILTELAKASAHSHGGGLLGFAKQILNAAGGGAKFSKDDVKKVYFGNWLRDYSQAMDIAGLSKLSAETIVMVVSVLAFLEFGYATEEFEVTADRLGVYLPVEHIDNPKGYAAKEGDARQFHPKLRPPVEDRELEIDERTGMKRYMASDNEGFDTSTAFIRRSFQGAIEKGRSAGGRDGADLWEAFRLMGQGLHTMEDLLAHSNWCEIALNKMGHQDVFCHVGDNVRINTPNGRAPPLVTGTFGSADFFHSLLGEATDKLSQNSMEDLSQKLNDAQNQDQNEKLELLRKILSRIMHSSGGNEDEKMQEADVMKQKSQAYHFDPDNVMPPEVQKQLLDLLKWRDNIMRDVSKQLAMIPGLIDLIEGLTDALNAYVYTLLAPYLTPILKQVTTVIGEGSKAVIDSDDQYAVFNDPDASDPSHSMMSKDHFALILNEPAGLVAKVVVENTVGHIVEAWSNSDNPDDVINRILEAFHHPYYATGNSEIQEKMIRRLEEWLEGCEDQQQILRNLTKESVREHKNKRFTEEQQQQVSDPHGHSTTHGGGGGAYSSTSYGRQQQDYSGNNDQYGSHHDQSSYSSGRNEYGQQSYGGDRGLSDQGYGGGRETSYQSYGQDQESSHRSYGGDRETSYQSHGGDRESSYQSSYDRNESSNQGYQPSYGSRHDEGESYGRSSYNNDSYGSRHEESSNRGYQPSYGSRDNEGESHGSRHEHGDSYGARHAEDSSRGYQPSYYSQENTDGGGDSYGERRHYGGDDGSSGFRRRDNNENYGGGYGGSEETFGAERLNINEDEGHDRRHRGYEGGGGYGGYSADY